jgi:hypothetical protein
VASFAGWYNHRQRHSGIKFVTPHQRNNGDAVEICRHRAVVYEQAHQQNPRRWTRSTGYCRQAEVAWINPPPPAIESRTAKLDMSAWTAAGASSFFLSVTAKGSALVLKAYRWGPKDTILVNLLDLNTGLAEKEKDGKASEGPWDPSPAGQFIEGAYHYSGPPSPADARLRGTATASNRERCPD